MQPRGASSSRLDVYQKVTDTIIAQIEAGAGAYRMPWHQSGSARARPRNVVTCSFYRGINVMALWSAAMVAGYPTGLWATYRQWQLIGAQVKEGERGTLIVFWNQLHHPAIPYVEDEENDTPRRIVARGFWVFNVAQVSGYQITDYAPLPEAERNVRAEQFYAKLGIDTRFGGDEAYYDPAKDQVQMPVLGRFHDASAFYATLLHEGAHASGAPHRLNRDLSGRFGSEAYAMEEMIADLASAMACMTLEISAEPRPDHAQYVASWLRVLKGDTRAVFLAANRAQKIVDWMHEKQTTCSA